MVQNHWASYKSKVVFEDLNQKQALLMVNSSEAYYSDCVHGPPSTASSRWVDGWPTWRPLLHGGGGGRPAVASTWPLMRNWDHPINRTDHLTVTVNDGKEMGGERCFRENAWYHCCMRLRSGSHRTNTAFDPHNQVKRINGQTGASLWFLRNTCGFSVDNYKQLRNVNASCHRATQCDDDDGAARRHTIGRSHVALHVANCIFRRLKKNLYFMTRV